MRIRVLHAGWVRALLAADAHATASVDEQGARQLSLTWFLAEPARVWVTAPSALAATTGLFAHGSHRGEVPLERAEFFARVHVP